MAPLERRTASDNAMAVVKPHLALASQAAADVSNDPTPAWLVKTGRYVSVMNFALTASHGVALPLLLAAWQWYTNYWLTYTEFFYTFLFGYYKLIVTFTLLHRFFAHKTFSASRPVAFLLGLVAVSGAQKGPLWWGSKHVRHHKFCENEGDPHSAPRFGFFYSYVGWTVHPREWYIDWEYLHAAFKTWEMLLCEALAGVVPPLENLACYYAFGFRAALADYWATVIAVHLTLFFNVYLHHDEEVDPKPMTNGRYKCRAHNKVPNMAKWVLDLTGEMDHLDHHRWPRKAFHPSTFVDLPYWLLIWPGEQLGIFYNVNHDGKQLSYRAQ